MNLRKKYGIKQFKSDDMHLSLEYIILRRRTETKLDGQKNKNSPASVEMKGADCAAWTWCTHLV